MSFPNSMNLIKLDVMKVVSKKSVLAGHIVVPGSKSHTIRGLILAAMADGVSHISNPLNSEDCLSTVEALESLGVHITRDENMWTVEGAGKNLKLPESSFSVNVGNSGSLMYFLSPVLATLSGEVIFTGDDSIRKRPVDHLLDAFNQLGVRAESLGKNNRPPFSFFGPIKFSAENDYTKKIVTDGALSQYISGFMMAATRCGGTIDIELKDPKETPYLTMTKLWLESLGVNVKMSHDFKHISVGGPVTIEGFDKTIPSDWEGVAFPLIAALISGSEITIDNVDSSGSQGDDKIVDILKSVGANIVWDKVRNTLWVKGNKILTTKGLPRKTLRVNISDFPDAICALSVIACFIEGKTVITDVEICRKKETDRVKAMVENLSLLGADIREDGDSLVINGHCPFNEDGTQNTKCKLHGGKVEVYKDHRIAMALACFGLGLRNSEAVVIRDGECCNVSFPGFFERMNKLGAGFGLSE